MGSSGFSWIICKQSTPRSREITTSTPHHSFFTGRMLVLTANQQRQTTEGSVYHPQNSKIYFAPTTHKATESSEHTALDKNEPTAWQALFTIGYFSLELITMLTPLLQARAVNMNTTATYQNLIFSGQASINASLVLLRASPLPPHEDNNNDDDSNKDQCHKNATNNRPDIPTTSCPDNDAENCRRHNAYITSLLVEASENCLITHSTHINVR